MKSEALVTATFRAEVTNISPHGIWLLADDEELYLAFDEFPWFRNARIAAVLHVERPHPGHLHWPELDVDLTLDSMRNPERHPLISRGGGGPEREADA
jgi:hypothetical protein